VGGWAAIVIDTEEVSIWGFAEKATNNRMEIKGAIEGLKRTPKGSEVEIISDSNYLIKAVTNGWLKNWAKNDWKKKDGHIINCDLWQELLALINDRVVTFTWVRGHNENKYNEMCDELAVAARKTRTSSNDNN
jgi:ribonuclease HI